jgi:hypothetical protein
MFSQQVPHRWAIRFSIYVLSFGLSILEFMLKYLYCREICIWHTWNLPSEYTGASVAFSFWIRIILMLNKHLPSLAMSSLLSIQRDNWRPLHLYLQQKDAPFYGDKGYIRYRDVIQAKELPTWSCVVLKHPLWIEAVYRLHTSLHSHTTFYHFSSAFIRENIMLNCNASLQSAPPDAISNPLSYATCWHHSCSMRLRVKALR